MTSAEKVLSFLANMSSGAFIRSCFHSKFRGVAGVKYAAGIALIPISGQIPAKN
jgi:hypothetical protein